MANKHIPENDSGLNKELDHLILKSQKNIEDKFNSLKKRLNETSILDEPLPKSKVIIEIFIKDIATALKELQKDAEDIHKGILFEIQEFEIRLNEILKQ